MKQRVLIAALVAALLVFVLALAVPQSNEGAPTDVQFAARFPEPTIISGLERSATLGLSPELGAYPVGSAFTVDVYAATDQIAINAAEASVLFPVDRLRVVRVSKEGSIFSLWPVEPVFSNEEGTVRFAGGLPSPGFLGNFGRIITVTFSVVNEGVSVVELSGGYLLANNGFGTDVLREMRHAVYTTQVAGRRRADINGDGRVDVSDLSVVLASLGRRGAEVRGDLNNDGRINFQDISIVLAEWSL